MGEVYGLKTLLVNQYSLSVGVVITDKLIRTSMIADRAPEWNGLLHTELPFSFFDFTYT